MNDWSKPAPDAVRREQVQKGVRIRNANARRRFVLIEQKKLKVGASVRTLDNLKCELRSIDEQGSLFLYHPSFRARGDSRNLRKFDPSAVELA